MIGWKLTYFSALTSATYLLVAVLGRWLSDYMSIWGKLGSEVELANNVRT